MRDAGNPIQMSGAPVLTEVCIGEETLRWADGPHGRLPVCGKVLDPAAYRAIRDETDRWAIREEISEWYDYDFYANLGGEQLHQMEFALNDETILVKDDTFYGIVLPYPDGSLRYACAAICVLPFSVLTNMMLQCSGHALPASFLALMRSGLFFLPILLLLNSLLGIHGIQLAQPIADVLTAAASLPFVIYYFRHLPPEQP